MGRRWLDQTVVPWWWGHYDSCTVGAGPLLDQQKMWQNFASDFLNFPGGPEHIRSLLWPQGAPLSNDTDEDDVNDIVEVPDDGGKDVVDLTNDTDEWIPALKLTMKDKREILNGDMLSDKHIYAAQTLLQKQFPWVRGFQDSCLSQTEFQPVGKGGIQIHHTRGNHWVLSSSLKPGFVQLYDSLYTDTKTDLERQLVEIYSDMAEFPSNMLYVDNMPCQKQYGGVDCGLFVIAWAYALCQGRDFTDKRFIQREMRRHFVECLEQGEIVSFPAEAAESFRRKPLPNIVAIDLNDYLYM